MLKIYLARHGQDEDNEQGILNGHRDKALTELGLLQARQLASFIKSSNLTFDKIYSSPLIRALTTAKEIAKTLNLPDPEITPLLIERNFGAMTGQKISDIKKICYPNIIEAKAVTYFLNSDKAENFPDLIIRAKKLFEFIKQRHQDGNVLLVSHGDFGKMIYAAYYNLAWEEALTMFLFGNSELVLLAKDVKPAEAKILNITQHNS